MSSRKLVSQSCLDAAFRYLSYRPRSEFELKMRLRQRGFDASSIEGVLRELRGQGLVDDFAFAQFWKENRESFSPRSRTLLHRELRQKGIAPHIIAEVIKEIDEEASAYKAAQNRVKRFAFSDYDNFCHRIAALLRRRGFSYEVSRHIINRLWQEREVSSKNA